MRFDRLIEVLFDVRVEDSMNENIPLPCPECGRNKFYFSREKGLGHCMHGDYDVNAERLLRDVTGCTLEEAVEELAKIASAPDKAEELAKTDSPNAHVYLAVINALQSHRAEERIEPSVELPGQLVPMEESPRARRYLRSRGIRQRYYAPYQLLYMPAWINTHLAGHIIFPNYDRRGRLDFWTSRATWEPRSGKKSWNPKGVRRRGVLYGAFAWKGGDLYIVEGPLDCIAMSQRAVALLGLTITNEQVEAIGKLKPKRIYVVLDPEAEADTVKVAGILSSMLDHIDIYYAVLKHDPAETLKRGGDPCAIVKDQAQAYSQVSALRSRVGRYFR